MPVLYTPDTSNNVGVATPVIKGALPAWDQDSDCSAGGASTPAVTTAGDSSNDISGGNTLATGAAAGSGSGNITIQTGNATAAATSGDVQLIPGTSPAGDAWGQVLRQQADSTLVTDALAGFTTDYSKPVHCQIYSAAAPQTITGAVANTVFGDHDFTIPADLLRAGATVRWRALCSVPVSDGVANTTVRIYLDGTGGVLLAQTQTVTCVAGAGGTAFLIDGVMNVRQDGAGGTAYASSFTMADQVSATANMAPSVVGAGAGIAYNTEAAHTIGVAVQFDALGTNVTLEDFVVSIATSNG